jgi:hypothetical protein
MKPAIKIYMLILSVAGTALWAHAQGTTFTYQGRLRQP